ncbi:hypothetical protein CLU96_4319 [Chryseobacterium sp. 52]|uniref:hypothetical protein n=1 Tax=Chryseobacterium sp. 52 TaxID=2035213 RepID=UPI000C191CD5|nr:hypothetical protein [Chryseobacterium sp. 52]PIF47269.1 hypothetical protein CLU96_4319 [Chryseobacterium sp. 52]
MILIDYIYYQLTNLYRYINKDETEKSYGVLMTCGLPCLNLIFILMLIDYFYIKDVLPNKYVAILYCLPIALSIGLRYWKFTSYEEIKEKVQGFSKTTKIIANILLIIYVLISFFGMIGFAGYVGVSRHR